MILCTQFQRTTKIWSGTRFRGAAPKFYDYYCIEEEYYRLNKDKPIELDIDIDWSVTIFHELGFDWWFDIRNH